MKDPPETAAGSEPPSATLYIHRLDDRINKNALKRALYFLCSQYGLVVDVVALKTLKMRGQAFVVFETVAEAAAARKALEGRAFLGRPLRIQYAKTESRALAVRRGVMAAPPRREAVGNEMDSESD